MVIEAATILGAANELSSLQQAVQRMIHKNRGPVRAMLLELTFNYRLVTDLYRSKETDPLPIIGALRTATYRKLISSDFSFRALKRGTVSKELAGSSNFLKLYAGKSTEELVTAVFEKIIIAKRYSTLHKKNSKLTAHIRFDVRLHNIGKMLVLLMRHLNR